MNPNLLYTFRTVWQAKWWKIPWYVIRRKPWRVEQVYENVEIGSMKITTDKLGNISMQVDALIYHPVENIATNLKIEPPHESN